MPKIKPCAREGCGHSKGDHDFKKGCTADQGTYIQCKCEGYLAKNQKVLEGVAR